MERDRSRLIGERAGLDASVARAKTRQSEIRVQIGAIDENARTEAQRELSVVETKLTEIVNRRIALEDRLSRTDIRATISGRINEVKVHTVGGVISPAEVLATIVPESARLKIEVKIPPVSIDQVAVSSYAAAFHDLQSAHHTRTPGRARVCIAGNFAGSEHRSNLLRWSCRYEPRGICQDWRRQVAAGNARGGVYVDGRADSDVVSAQARRRPVQPSHARALTE